MEVKSSEVSSFEEFQLSKPTMLGLKKAGYFKPTEIQHRAIGFAMQGCDILGAAKTGSGKTVAFLIPVLEKLHREKWTRLDGLGALIITPTRELAYQIFEVLKRVGVHHDFSAGLVIGGKDLKFETTRMDRCNIIICTPGRILQHMDENPLFTAENLHILVLDEADRILDLGFEKTMNAILENLPICRQTMLFSATQTKSVKDLARLSLKDPEYISVHENAQYSTPEALKQIYVVCNLHEKMDALWSFIKTHLKQKILVFMSSCKQVKYTYEVFCRMRPGTSVLALYGTLHQLRRMAIYDDFCRKQSAVLFSTDIASRGLDFPSVHWVVQVDCPEDGVTYIHRVGRTARFEKNGQAMLVLLPSEETPFVEQLTERKIPIQKIDINPRKQISVLRKMEALCARDVSLKQSAQRACVAYMKSIFFMKDKRVFDVSKVDVALYARSLGLAIPPRIRFLQKHLKMQNISRQQSATKTGKLDSHGNESEDLNRHVHARSPNAAYSFQKDNSEEDESGDDFLTVKSTIYPGEESLSEIDVIDEEYVGTSRKKVLTKAAVVKKMMKKKIKPNRKTVFDNEGEAVESFPREQKSQLAKELATKVKESGIDLEVARQIMSEEDKIDKQLYRQRVKAMHQMKRLKKKAENNTLKGRLDTDFKHEDDESNEEVVSSFVDALPDPDKVYAEDLLHNEDGEKELSTSFQKEMPKKRKQSKKDKINKKIIVEVDDTFLDTGLSLVDDEELALRFLAKNKIIM